MSTKTRILRLTALIFTCAVTFVMILFGILLLTIGKSFFNTGWFALHGMVIIMAAIAMFIVAIINGIFIFIDLKIVIKSQKKHVALGIFQIIFGGIVPGVLILIAGDGQ